MELIENKYYKCVWQGDIEYIWYFKFSHIELDRIYVYYCIENGEFFNKENSLCYYYEDEIFDEVLIDEIVYYLPKNNKDRIYFLCKKKINNLLTC